MVYNWGPRFLKELSEYKINERTTNKLIEFASVKIPASKVYNLMKKIYTQPFL